MAEDSSRRPHRRVTLWLAAVLIVAAPVPASAQNGAQPPQESSPRLELTLADAVRIAFENNLDIRIVRYDAVSAAEGVRTARGRFEPVFNLGTPGLTQLNPFPSGGAFGGGGSFGGFGFVDLRSPSSSQLAGADTLTSKSFTTRFDVQKLFEFGTRVDVSYSVGRNRSNSVFQSLNPSWDNTLAISIVQPLLRGRGREAAAAELLLARANERVSAEAFRAQVEGVLLQVEQAYWQLVFAQRDLEVKQLSVQLAREQLERTRAQVEVGLIAPVEVTQAEVQVAARETDLINARNALEDARDALRALLRAEALPAGWDTPIEPIEAPTVEPRTIDLDSEVRAALARRPEVAQAAAAIRARNVQVAASRDALQPRVDLLAQVSTNGIGGDLIVREGFPGRVVEVIPGGYGDAVDQLFGLDFVSWRVGLNVSLPLGNSTAQGQYAQATIAEDQARARLESVRQQIELEVRRAVRGVQAAAEAAAAARKTRELAERQLAIETDRFEVGMSTNFEVLQFQDDLAAARSAELQALIRYRLARAELERATGRLLEDYGLRLQSGAAAARPSDGGAYAGGAERTR